MRKDKALNITPANSGRDLARPIFGTELPKVSQGLPGKIVDKQVRKSIYTGRLNLDSRELSDLLFRGSISTPLVN